MKATKRFELSNGATGEVTFEKAVVNMNRFADDNRIENNEIITSVAIALYNKDGVKILSVRHEPKLISEMITSEKNKAEWTAAGAYAYTSEGLIRKESYDAIMCALAEAKAEVEEALLDDAKYQEVAEKEAQEEQELHEQQISEAQRVVERASKQDKVMTQEEYRAWRKRYNDVMNEGGEGYIPDLVTVEQLEKAKRFLAKQK